MEIPVHTVSLTSSVGNMSASSCTSDVLRIDDLHDVAIHVRWSGSSCSGSLVTEASNDGANFATLDTLSISTDTGNKMYNYSRAGYSYVRCTYTRSAGTGSLYIIMNGKV